MTRTLLIQFWATTFDRFCENSKRNAYRKEYSWMYTVCMIYRIIWKMLIIESVGYKGYVEFYSVFLIIGKIQSRRDNGISSELILTFW